MVVLHLSKLKEIVVFAFISLIGVSSVSIIFMSSSLLLLWKNVYGDGLTQEQLSASLGNRRADLLIKLIPTVVTTETLQKGQKPIVEFRLFDSNTNKSFSHVTYYITIEKNDRRVIADIFHDHNGDLRIEMKPSNNTSGGLIISDLDPTLDAYTGNPGRPVTISGPVFSEGGLYHFKVRIEGVDSDDTLLPNDQRPVYDSWLSIGNALNQQININGKQIPIKIVSYYDTLKNFTFDSKNSHMRMQFDMPFNWNLSRLHKANIFVHEEISVPKPNSFTANKSYLATVNGVDVSKNIMIDDTKRDMDIIHFMLPKNQLIQVADEVNKNGQAPSGLMKFALQPGSGQAMSSSSMGNMSMSMPMSSSQ